MQCIFHRIYTVTENKNLNYSCMKTASIRLFYFAILNRRKIADHWVELVYCTFFSFKTREIYSFVQFSSVAQSCLTLCNAMDHTGPPVHHQLPELTQTHVHWVDDAIQPSHPLLSPSPPAFNLPQHHGLFQWLSFSQQVAKVVEFQLHHQSFQWIFRTDFL